MRRWIKKTKTLIRFIRKLALTWGPLKTSLSIFSNKNRVFKNFFTYFIGILILKGTYFVLLPVYTRELTKAEYGQLELINIFISVITLIFSLGLTRYLPLIYFHHEGVERKRHIVQIVFTYIYLATPIVFIAFFLVPQLQAVFLSPDISRHLIYMALSISFISFFPTIIIYLQLVMQRAKTVISIQVSIGVLGMFLNIIFILVFHFGITGIILTQLISAVLICLIGLFLFSYSGIWSWRKVNLTQMWESIRLGVPLVASTFFVLVMIGADRWFLSYYSSNADIGIYSLAYRFASLFEVIFLVSLASAYSPYTYSLFQKDGIVETEKKNSKVMKLYSIIICPLSLVIVFLMKPVFEIFVGAEFHDAYIFIFPVLISYFFLGIMNMSGMSIMFKKKTNYIFASFFVGAASNILMNYYAIPKYNIWGAAITTMLSYFFVMICLLFFRQKVIRSQSQRYA